MQWNEFRPAIKHVSATQQTRIKPGFELGERKHGPQKRKSGEPYFNHPITVATMLANMGADPDTIIAALLHDTVEDTDLTLPEIEEQFGPTVRTLIEGVTKLSVSDVGGPNLDEQTETLRKIFTLMETDVRIMVIKIIDRLHNMQTVEFLKEERQRTLSQETQDVYVKIADRLCMQDIRDELEALCLGILEPAVFKRLVALREENQTKGTAVVKEMQKRLQTHFPEHTDDVHMKHEDKSWDSLREQLNTEGTAVTGVSGLTAVFVCDTLDTCYRVLGILHQMWKRESMSFQDFINTPTINGYRGLHTTVILEDGTRVRCKIRTQQMHEYARKGVTTLCFRSDTRELHDWLPWTQRISPLSADTLGRSKEFWDTLQSDILGESILIYGPGDQTMLVPKGSTALDGALYMFGKDALKLTSLSIGGKETTALDMPLTHAISLNVTLGDNVTVKREWIDKARTGYATALIRGALVEGKSDTEKIPVGRELLQRVLRQNRKGFLEEFSEQHLTGKLQQLGYGSLPELYIAIANGRIEPSSAYAVLFEKQKKNGANGNRAFFRMQYVLESDGNDTLDRIHEIHRKYRHDLQNTYYKLDRIRTVVAVQGTLTLQEREEFAAEIQRAGGKDLQITSKYTRIRRYASVGVLVMLWGLDPVFAHELLKNITVVDLTFIRFGTFLLASLIGYATHTFFSSAKLKPLSPFHPLLVLCGVALFLTGLLTYLTVDVLYATQYILFIIGGLILTVLARQLFEKTFDRMLFVTGLLVAATLALTFFYNAHFPSSHVLAAVGASLSFSLYSLLSKRYQDVIGKVRERYPAYMFWVSLVCFVFALPMLPYTTLSTLSAGMFVTAMAFVFVFTILPYVLYFELMRRMDPDVLDGTLPFVCISTIIGEAVFTGSLFPLVSIPIALFFLLHAMRPAPTFSPAASTTKSA